MSLCEARRSRHKASGDLQGGHAPQLRALKKLQFQGYPNKCPTAQKATSSTASLQEPGQSPAASQVRGSHRQKARETSVTPPIHFPHAMSGTVGAPSYRSLEKARGFPVYVEEVTIWAEKPVWTQHLFLGTHFRSLHLEGILRD